MVNAYITVMETYEVKYRILFCSIFPYLYLYL